MSDFFGRRGAAYWNEMARSCGALLGIAQGMLADGSLNDAEIRFLHDWLSANDTIACAWPGDVLHARLREVLADGHIGADERQHLTDLLQALVGGSAEDLVAPTHVTALALDRVQGIDFDGKTFCLTGDFVFGPRTSCAQAIERRGGRVADGITKKLAYVVVGGLGSPEWKHGSYGTKIEKAMTYKAQGLPLLVVHEDVWASSLGATPAA